MTRNMWMIQGQLESILMIMEKRQHTMIVYQVDTMECIPIFRER